MISTTTGIPLAWPLELQLFLPTHHQDSGQLRRLRVEQIPAPRITWLEAVAPWSEQAAAVT